MQDAPLLISGILRHGQRVYGESKVITVEADGYREATFAEVAERAERLAAALQRLGVAPGDRVATFCWNNQVHLECYLAVPSMGAVLHTLNIRLYPEQLAYVIDHAEDKVIIVDGSLIPLLARVYDDLKSVETVIVVGEGDPSPLGETLSYEALLAAEEPGFEWPEFDERDAAAMCYTSGTTGNPKGVVYSHRSTVLHSMAVTSASSLGMTESDRLLCHRPHVPRQRLGHALRRLPGGHRPGDAADVPPGRAPGPDHRRPAPHAGLRRAHHLERPAAGGRRRPTCRRCGTSPPAARPSPGRSSRPSRPRWASRSSRAGG